jgi:hypothetical protein
MTMRRAEFKEIAEVIREYRLLQKDLGTVTIDDLIQKFCTVFKQSNPTFDKGKFLKACGYYQE